MPQRSPLINGKNYSWSDLTFILLGVPIIGITEINYGRRQKKTMNYGAGNEPVSYGTGNYEYYGDITVYKDELKAILQTAPGRSILNVPPSTASCLYEGDSVPTTIDNLRNIMFTEDPFSSKQNDSLILVKVPFIFAGLDQ